MLFTEQDLYVNNGLNILNEATYLSEEESLINPITIPVKKVDRLGYGVVRFDDVEKLAEDYGVDYIDAMYAIAESSDMNPEYLAVSVPEEDIIAYPEIVNELANIVVQPLSEYDDEYQYVAECVNVWLESGNDEYLGLLLELAPAVMEKLGIVDFSASSDDEIHNWINKVVGSELAGKTGYGLHTDQRQHDLTSYIYQARNELEERKKYGSPKGGPGATRDYQGMQLARIMQDGKANGITAARAQEILDARTRNQLASRMGQTHAWRQSTPTGLDTSKLSLDGVYNIAGDHKQVGPTTQKRPGTAYPTLPDNGRDEALLGIINKTSKEKADAENRAGKVKGQYGKLVQKHKNLKGKWYVRAGEKVDSGIDWVKNNKGKTALGVGLGAAAIGGGIYAYKQYKNKPRSVIAKRIAALRSIYKKFMINAQRNPKQANVLQRMAAKILNVIDKLLGFLQNKADGR